MDTETVGAVALGAIFFFVVLMVLGWRFPQTLSVRIIIGAILGIFAVGALVYVSESVLAFAKKSGLYDMIVQTQI
jgi:Na+-transporting NADH:ubiquinone oxidoreductase subunit NqrB